MVCRRRLIIVGENGKEPIPIAFRCNSRKRGTSTLCNCYTIGCTVISETRISQTHI